ncbi:hypothetical protein [Nocardia terpenica]|uniref:SpoVT-AbrB domain-containing protein n=1 Tax=Nocardia terpenica TaxID=455432 RepID=A0A164IXC9_9NOCA|nr:hypothetical protein [Nocardia terpenica]KZM69831.1 hypothetical protein AWN90_04255 [Nocardia terpenica]NQE91183.1 hypothetical protein [Nocardia terpenica]
MDIEFDGLFGRFEPSQPPFRGLPGLRPEPVPEAHIGEIYCATTTVDMRGRIGDRSVINLLSWHPGHKVSFQVEGHIAVVRRTVDRGWSITKSGYLHLPAAIRREWDVGPSDRVLLAATSKQDALVIYSMAAVSAALWAYRSTVWSGDEE